MSRLFGEGDDDVADELRHHIDERADQLVEQGWEPDAARREAERRFGDVERVRRRLATAEARRSRRLRLGELARSSIADLVYAVRGIRARPTFAAATVATLAIGVGAAASIFSVADALLLRPLPYAASQRWVRFGTTPGGGGTTPGPVAVDRFRRWREASSGVIDGWVVHQWNGLARTDRGAVETLDVLAVTPGADTLLGLALARGRGLRADDALPGADAVAVLTRRYWEALGRDPSVVGRTMSLEGSPVTVVGILRDDTKFPPEGRDIDVWVPVRSDYTFLDRRLGVLYGVWARLAPGVSLTSARARLDALAAGVTERSSDGAESWDVAVTPVEAGRAEAVRGTVATLAATVAVMFLIALLNGVNLLLVRTAGRTREIGVRIALGASRARLLRQLAAEGVVLGVLSGSVAATLAWGALVAMRRVLPTIVTYVSPFAVGVDGRAVLFAFTVAASAGLLLGLLPALGVVRRTDPSVSLAGRRVEDLPRQRWLRSGLVVTQVALSMVLLVWAGLLVAGFARLHAVDVGIDVDRVAVADLEPSRSRYATEVERAAFATRLERALEDRPEIGEVALTSSVRAHSGVPLEAEGLPIRSDQPSLVPWAAVAPVYVDATGLRVVEGRGFEIDDIGEPVAVVDQDLARFLWNDRSALGRRFRVGDGDWLRVIGVVDELRLIGRDERAGPHQYLIPRDPLAWSSRLGLIMRSAGPPADALVPVFLRTLRALDPEQSYWQAQTASERLAFNEEEPRFVTTLLVLLAAVSATLASIGLYGVLSYSVARRTREIGVRAALGADPGRLMRGVVGEGIAAVAIGIGIGLVLVLGTGRWLELRLYEVPPHDPATLAAAGALFLCVAAVASFVPARRATRVDPAEVLRGE